jgi:hypothetical protein
VISLARVLYSWRSYFDAALWAALGSGQDAVIAHWGKIGVFFVLMLGVALQLITIFLLYLLFTKRRGFAPGYLGLIWIELLWSVLNRLSLSAVGMSTAAPRVIGLFVALELIGTLIWTAYMLRSERVRVTFVRTRSGPPTVTPGSAETSDSPEARTAEQAC